MAPSDAKAVANGPNMNDTYRTIAAISCFASLPQY